MEKLIIEATKYTPRMVLDPVGVIELNGKSYPENTFEFYAPFINWLKKYFLDDNSPKELIVNIEVTYFNSSSSKLFFDFFDLLEENKEDFKIRVNWIYDEENESALEAGDDFLEDFSDLITLVVKE